MSKLSIAALAAAFGASATFGILLGGAQTPAQAHPALLSAAATIAAADENENENGNDEVESGVNAGVQVADRNENDNDNDNEDNNNQGRGRGNHGNQNCVNPAGHERGWCKHHNRGNNRGNSTISGTVTGINGNMVNFQLDNGQTITVLDNNGTQLNVGQHYRLRGNYQNGQFVLGGNNYNNGGYNNGQTVSGNIVAIGNGTVTLLGVPPVTVNVQQANNNNATNGALSIGRHITAYGYYSNNVFYATSIQ